MTRKAAWILLALVVTLVIAPAAFGQTTSNAAASTTNWIAFAAAIGLGIAAAGCGMGQGRATASACEGIARNPGAAGPLRISFILGLVFIESLSLYMFAVVLIELFK